MALLFQKSITDLHHKLTSYLVRSVFFIIGVLNFIVWLNKCNMYGAVF